MLNRIEKYVLSKLIWISVGSLFIVYKMQGKGGPSVGKKLNNVPCVFIEMQDAMCIWG